MKRSTELVVFAVVNVVFLTVAFLAGYAVRAMTDGGGGAGLAVPGTGERYPVLAEVRRLLEAHYIGTLPSDKELEYGAARGLVSAVDDPYTVFVEPQTHELDTHSLQGEYGGVGMTLSLNEAGEVVLDPYPDSAAAAAGVQAGDILLAVDGQALTPDMRLEDVTVLVRGPVGTTVRLTVRHASGAEETLTIERALYEIPSVTWRIVDEQPTIGVIAVSRFSDKTPGEVGRAIGELHAQGVTEYVLDLRNNGGGVLEAAVETAGHFLGGGVVMYETQRNAPDKVYTAPDTAGPAHDAPLVVLVNHGTASAAEIVAGALLDRERAPLVGQPTFGKGSVQLVYDLSDGSSLHVTAYRWYTPKRRVLEEVGLPPTFVVEPSPDGGDAELAYAVQYLNQIAGRADERVAQETAP